MTEQPPKTFATAPLKKPATEPRAMRGVRGGATLGSHVLEADLHHVSLLLRATINQMVENGEMAADTGEALRSTYVALNREFVMGYPRTFRRLQTVFSTEAIGTQMTLQMLDANRPEPISAEEMGAAVTVLSDGINALVAACTVPTVPGPGAPKRR